MSKRKEQRTRLATYRVDMPCPRRGCKGLLRFNGSGVTPGIGPTMWEHGCTECDGVFDLDTSYPRVVHEEARDDR